VKDVVGEAVVSSSAVKSEATNSAQESSNSEPKLSRRAAKAAAKSKGLYSSTYSSSNSESKLPPKSVSKESALESGKAKLNSKKKGLYSSSSNSESKQWESQARVGVSGKGVVTEKASFKDTNKSEETEKETCDNFNYNEVKEYVNVDSVIDYLAPLKLSSKSSPTGTSKSNAESPQKGNKKYGKTDKKVAKQPQDRTFLNTDIRYRGKENETQANDVRIEKEIESKKKKHHEKLYSATSESIITLSELDSSRASTSPDKIQKLKDKNEQRKKLKKEKSKIKKERKMAQNEKSARMSPKENENVSMDQSLMSLALNYDHHMQCKSAESDSQILP